MKVTILLEELLAVGVSGAEYNAWLIDIYKGDQLVVGQTLNPPFLSLLARDCRAKVLIPGFLGHQTKQTRGNDKRAFKLTHCRPVRIGICRPQSEFENSTSD